jgi:pyrrolidone-carboxylate peptidase
MLRVLSTLLMVVPLLAPPAANATPDCYDTAAPLTVEENRLTATLPTGGPPVGPALVAAAGFDDLVTQFTTSLCESTSESVGHLVATSGAALWRTAVDRAQGRRPDLGTLDRYDDRPLYWARLEMTKALRQWQPSYAADRAALLSTMDHESRGIPLAAGTVLVTGFDPFSLDGDGLRTTNTAGAAALQLDGRMLDTPDGPVQARAAILPVLWEAFDQGVVESTFGPALHDHPPKTIITVSLGAGFSIERWAAAWRNGAPDNNNAGTPGPVPPAAGWPQPDDQFIETTLPSERMIATQTGPKTVRLNELYCVWPDSTKPGEGDFDCRFDGAPTPDEKAALGGGGNYLSNESMYRANRLRLGLGATNVQGGHLHIPSSASPADPTALTDAASEADRQSIVDQTVALTAAAAN